MGSGRKPAGQMSPWLEMNGGYHAGFAHTGESDAAIGRRFGGRHGKGCDLRLIVDPVHELFASLAGDRLQDLAAANFDEEEEAPAHDGERL
jgi:hypothetical protein